MMQFTSAKKGMTSIGCECPGGDPRQRHDHIGALHGLSIHVVKRGVEAERVAARERNTDAAGERHARRLLSHRHEPLDHWVEQLATAVIGEPHMVHHPLRERGPARAVAVAELHAVAAHPSIHRPRDAKHGRIHQRHVARLMLHRGHAERAGDDANHAASGVHLHCGRRHVHPRHCHRLRGGGNAGTKRRARRTCAFAGLGRKAGCHGYQQQWGDSAHAYLLRTRLTTMS